MTQASIFERALDPSNRANPYPLYAELRKTPVIRQENGTYVVSTHEEIVALLHDPRISSAVGDPVGSTASPGADSAGSASPEAAGLPPSFIRRDPPDHDRLRRMAMRHFGPPHAPDRIDAMRPALAGIVTGLIDGFAGRGQVDIVDDFAYPFPVGVICQLLGVPSEDEPRFRQWVDPVVAALADASEESQRVRAAALTELGTYLYGLAQRRREEPGDDLLSGFVTDDGPDGRMTDGELMSTVGLLLIAGHETTVNLITNGMLTLLRHPEVLARLRTDADLSIRVVEELLRYEPPVHFLPNRTALADIEIAGTVIPKGSHVVLLLASGSRDASRVSNPERFDPDRLDRAPGAYGHLGFGSGIHYCFGAPLARLEAQIALPELARRLENPRLVADPPPYRPSPVLRGPRHLIVEFDRINP